MGVGLSCLGSQEKLRKPVSSDKLDGTTCGSSSSSVLDFLKLDCFSGRDHQATQHHHSSAPVKRSNRDDDEEEQRMKMKRSLGEWLAEPSPTSGRSTFRSSMESFIFMSFSKKVHPSSSVNNPKGSFSAKEKLLNDEGEDGGLGRQSQKEKKLKMKKKKVSFKLPEDNEIIILPHSPDSNEEEEKDKEDTS